jgi:hypothetical protein
MVIRTVARQGALALAILSLCVAPALTTPDFTAYGATASSTATPTATPTPTPTPTPPSFGGEQNLANIPNVVDVWTQPSIFPGEPLNLHVSSPTQRYALSIRRVTFSGSVAPSVVFTTKIADGVDQRDLITWDSTTATATAPWPTSFSVETVGWLPGVYTIETMNGVPNQSAKAIFVVKTPTINRLRPLFALSFLTLQAYNDWGGSSAYPPNRAVRISLQRPIKSDTFSGAHGWEPQASWLIWMSRHVVGLQYTTDYDLSLAAPATNPSALMLGQHTEYISKTFRDWVDLASGDAGKMAIANFGTNTFYCQVRLVNGIEAGSPSEMVVYKYPSQDPLELTKPLEAAVFFRSDVLSRPEGALFGTQYGASNAGLPSSAMKVSGSIPSALLKGTGLKPGSRLLNVYRIEADYLYPATGRVVIGSATYRRGKSWKTMGSVIRTGRLGARIFSAGSLVWVTGFTGPQPFGMKRASFIRFNANILDWLRIKRR